MLTLVKKFHDWANNNNSCVCYMWNALRNRSLAKWARVTRSHFIHRGNHRVTCAFRARLSAMHVLKWTIAGASWREKSRTEQVPILSMSQNCFEAHTELIYQYKSNRYKFVAIKIKKVIKWIIFWMLTQKANNIHFWKFKAKVKLLLTWLIQV